MDKISNKMIKNMIHFVGKKSKKKKFKTLTI